MCLLRLVAFAMMTVSLAFSGVRAEQDDPRGAGEARIASDLPSQIAQDLSLPSAELTALKMFYEGRRNGPVWVTSTGYTIAAQMVRAELERADEWGLQPSALRIPPSPEGQPSISQLARAEIALSQSILKYAQFARGGRTEPLALSRNLDRKPSLLDPVKVIAEIAASDAPDAYLRSLHPRHPQFDRLRRLYAQAKSEPDAGRIGRSKERRKSSATSSIVPSREKILANMEQWRWMPEDLGSLYVWVNIPEYIVRVFKDGREIHNERVIVGATTTPTPVLSDEMEQIIFNPRWNVPDSIKVNELLPSLEVGDYRVLSRQNLKVALGGRDIDARSVDWTRKDIRKYYFYQPPGSSNALGAVKFLFPNKHDVYLHDTPSKKLFNSQARAFSHGCIRVRLPMKLAELLLAESQGWDASRVAMTVQKGPQDNQISVGKIAVHLTYFTLWVDDDGRVRSFPDVYDHEHRVVYALAGKTHRIRREPEPPVARGREPSRVVSTERRPRQNGDATPARGFEGGEPDWTKQVFQ